jgi:predicted membrane GTPase involved in stress response
MDIQTSQSSLMDHEKPLVDGMLKQTHTFRIMKRWVKRRSWQHIEREKGIAILAKTRFNTDTRLTLLIPRARGFSVVGGSSTWRQRTLVVDAAEGPFPRHNLFCKSSQHNKIIVIINKIDRRTHGLGVLSETEAYPPWHAMDHWILLLSVLARGESMECIPQGYGRAGRPDAAF